MFYLKHPAFLVDFRIDSSSVLPPSAGIEYGRSLTSVLPPSHSIFKRYLWLLEEGLDCLLTALLVGKRLVFSLEASSVQCFKKC